jgi:hypothetical protein
MNQSRSGGDGRDRDSLPQTLARCGYRSVMFYPMLRHFLGAGRFFDSVGFRDLDAKAQRSTLPNGATAYYANALDDRPPPAVLVAAAVCTCRPWPPTVPTTTPQPEVTVPGGGPGIVRNQRVPAAAGDVAHGLHLPALELTRRFPGEAFLTSARRSQPTAVQSLLGFATTSIEDIMASGNGRLASPTTPLTPCAIARHRCPAAKARRRLPGHRYSGIPRRAAAAILPRAQTIDDAVQRPLSGLPEQQQILRFHRSLIDAGLIKAF